MYSVFGLYFCLLAIAGARISFAKLVKRGRALRSPPYTHIHTPPPPRPRPAPFDMLFVRSVYRLADLYAAPPPERVDYL